MSKIYIVQGAARDYSDHSEWVVGYYQSEANAREHVERANKHSSECGQILADLYDEKLRILSAVRDKHGPCPAYPQRSGMDDWDLTNMRHKLSPTQVAEMRASIQRSDEEYRKTLDHYFAEVKRIDQAVRDDPEFIQAEEAYEEARRAVLENVGDPSWESGAHYTVAEADLATLPKLESIFSTIPSLQGYQNEHGN